MGIVGLQETTLIDYPGEIACTLFFFGCNFRCGFCHNPELVVEENNNRISEEKILEFLKKRCGQLDGVCITGGEPLMSITEDFLKKIKDLGYKIKIDTNGSFPERLKDLVEKCLVDFVAMDIKTDKENYSKVCSCNVDIKKIEESIRIISKLKNYEFRTTILEGMHSENEIENLSKWLNEICRGKPKKFILQGFKNKGKMIDLKFRKEKDTSEEYLKKIKEKIKQYFEKVEIRV